MKRMVWFTKSTGLNIETDPVRNIYDDEDGVSSAKTAVDVDYDVSGRVSRRKGWSYTDVADSCHSLFCDGGPCLFVKGDALCLLGSDDSYKALRNVSVGAKMSYTPIEAKVYYSNGREKGFVSAGLSRSWTLPATVSPAKDSTKVLSAPPVGSMIEYHNGRMYVIQQNTAWFSEYMNLNVFDLTKNYMNFEAPLTMFRGVNEGVWVGTGSRTVFLVGGSAGNFEYKRKALCGVLKGSDVLVDGFLIATGEVEGVGVIFASTEGIFFGDERGGLHPLTNRNIRIPHGVNCSAVVKDKKYILTIESTLTIVLNLEMLGVSQYTNFGFNSYCERGADYLAAGSSGIRKIGAYEKDIASATSLSNINSKYEIALTDFGIRTEKRIRKASISYESAGEMRVTCKVNEGEDYTTHTEYLPNHDDNRQHIVHAPVGRDLKGRYFSLLIENIKGADFSVDEIEAYVSILLRKPVKEGAN